MNKNNKIRVLVVDDSFFMRRLLRELINSHPEMEVVGEAKDGVEAIGQAINLKPDVITMDFNMPRLTGAEATGKILQEVEPLPVVLMVSAYTKEGAEETLESLRAGAVDFIQKPSGELSLDIDRIKDEIFEKIKMAAKARVRVSRKVESRGAGEAASAKGYGEPREKKKKIKVSLAKVIVIGASTGGPPIVEDIMAALPSDLPAAVIIVQHMPKYFTASFAERLDRISSLKIKEAEEKDEIKAGHGYVAPGDFHLEIKAKDNNSGKIIHLSKGEPFHGLRPAIDVTMKSVAEHYKNNIIGIILTGMGEDGSQGMRTIKSAGGHTIVQEPETCVVDSMPSEVINNKMADEILKPEKIAKRIIELIDQ